MKKILNNELGQTAVEYVLLVAVMTSIVYGVMQIINDRMGLDGNSCPPDSINPICFVRQAIDVDPNNPFKFFRIIGAN